MVEKIMEAARAALAGMFPAILEIGTVQAEALAMNRLYRMKDGTETKSRACRFIPGRRRICGGLALVSFPNEIFSAISLQVQRLSPFPQTITVELSHQITTTYVPTLEQARNGAYGTVPITSRWMSEEAGVIYADRAVELLWRMRKAPVYSECGCK